MTHDGHRQRLKDRFLNNGLDSFEPHEVLELLLFFALPRKDTNAIAHALIRQFGSVSNVLDANYEDLKSVPGVGPHAAFLLNFVPSLARAYGTSKIDKKTKLLTTKAIGEFAIEMYNGKADEEFGIICVDSNRKVKYSGTIIKGTINQTAAYPRVILLEVLKHKVLNVILTHNHPGGSLMPSYEDRKATESIVDALKVIDVHVIDHIIVAGDQFSSMRDLGMMP